MNKLVRSSLALAIGLGLTACGGDGATTGPVGEYNPGPTSLDISGKSVKGALANATVTIREAGSDTTLVTGIQTDEFGKFSLNLSNINGERISGAFIITVTADSDTTMVCDAAVSCGDVMRGELIPAEELVGLEFTSFAFADSTVGTAQDFDANALTTMATNAILSAVSLNDDLTLSNLEAEDTATLQVAGSEVVGSILGLDLKGVSLYDVDIVDTSVSEDVSTDDAYSATLSLVNSSLAALPVVLGSTYADSLDDYLDNVEAITDAVLADPEVNLAEAQPDAIADVNDVQMLISTESAAIQAEVEMDTGESIPAVAVPDMVDPEDITDGINDAGQPASGATGATSE